MALHARTFRRPTPSSSSNDLRQDIVELKALVTASANARASHHPPFAADGPSFARADPMANGGTPRRQAPCVFEAAEAGELEAQGSKAQPQGLPCAVDAACTAAFGSLAPSEPQAERLQVLMHWALIMQPWR